MIFLSSKGLSLWFFIVLEEGFCQDAKQGPHRACHEYVAIVQDLRNEQWA